MDQVRLHILLQLDGLAEWMPAMAEQVGSSYPKLNVSVTFKGDSPKLVQVIRRVNCQRSYLKSAPMAMISSRGHASIGTISRHM